MIFWRFHTQIFGLFLNLIYWLFDFLSMLKAYYQLQSSMISELETRYTSDNLSSGDIYSKAWNDFFIEVRICSFFILNV